MDEIKCYVCGKKMVNDIDPITKEISNYIFKASCACLPKNHRLSVG